MAITTDEELQTEVGKLAVADPTNVPPVTGIVPTVGTGEDIASASGQLGTGPTTTTYTAMELGTPMAVIQGQPSASIMPQPIFPSPTPRPTVPTAPPANVGQIASVDAVTPDVANLGGAQAAQLTPTQPYVDMTGVQGTVSAGSQATAATQQLDPQATVQYQLGQLMTSVQSGAPLPPWASPAVRKVSGIMQARGLGASSMAGAAITQASWNLGFRLPHETLISTLQSSYKT